ncbi:MAG: hypothetical protein ACT4QE_15310 [Anaerolineales bacterium]
MLGKFMIREPCRQEVAMWIVQRHITRFCTGWVLVVALMLGPGAPPVHAGGVVGNGTPGSCTEAAFDAALAGGGTVTFNCGPEHTIYITSQKSINLNTTIDGGDDIKLDGLNATRLFDVGAVLTLRNITLARGYFNGDGGAIRNNSNGTLILENSTIGNSTATASGGAILSTGPMTITNSLLEGNRALNGGALYPRWAGSQTTIINSVLRDNHTTDMNNGLGGAILAFDGAPVTITNSDISNNTAGYGGGIYNFANSTLTLQSNTRLRDNHANNLGRRAI